MNRIVLRICLICLLGSLTISQALGQAPDRRWALSLGVNFLDYYAPEGAKMFRPANMDFGYRAGLHRYLSTAFRLEMNFTYAYGVRFPSFQTTSEQPGLADLNYCLNFKFNNGTFLGEKAFVAPYLTLGFGGSYIRDNPDLYVPLGGGLNFRVGHRTAIRAEVIYKRSLNNDFQHIAHGIYLVYNLGRGDGPLPTDSKSSKAVPPSWTAQKAPDQDNDGIPDYQDMCPEDPGLWAYQGCPTYTLPEREPEVRVNGQSPDDLNPDNPIVEVDPAQIKEQNDLLTPATDIEIKPEEGMKPDSPAPVAKVDEVPQEEPEGKFTDSFSQSDKPVERPRLADVVESLKPESPPLEQVAYPDAETPVYDNKVDPRTLPRRQVTVPREVGSLVDEEEPVNTPQFVPTTEERQPVQPVQEFLAPSPAESTRDNSLCAQLKNAVSPEAAVYFSRGSKTLDKKDEATLKEVARKLQSCDNVRLEVLGFADGSGGERNSKILSVLRANEVKRYLVYKLGISLSRISCSGFGNTPPEMNVAGENPLQSAILIWK